MVDQPEHPLCDKPDHFGRHIEHPMAAVHCTHFINGRHVDGRMN